jgi:hypothetical protein
MAMSYIEGLRLKRLEQQVLVLEAQIAQLLAQPPRTTTRTKPNGKEPPVDGRGRSTGS